MSSKATSAPPKGGSAIGSSDQPAAASVAGCWPGARPAWAGAWPPPGCWPAGGCLTGRGRLGARWGRRRQVGVEVDRAEVEPAVDLGQRAAEVGHELALGRDLIEADREVGQRHALGRAVELAFEGQALEALAREVERLAEPGRELADRGHGEIEPARGRGPGAVADPAGEAEFGGRRIDRELEGRGAAPDHRERLIELEVELDRLALVGERASRLQRALEVRQLDREVDGLEALMRAAGGVGIGERAVLDVDVAELDLADRQGGAAARGVAAAGRRGGGFGGSLRPELPVGPAVLGDLEMDLGLDQDEARDLDRAVQERPDLELDLERLEPGHVRVGGAGRVGEAHVLGLERHARQQREVERALDGELAAGQALDLGSELLLVGLGRDDEGQDQRHADQQDDQAQNDQEELLHGATSGSDASRLAYGRALGAARGIRFI